MTGRNSEREQKSGTPTDVATAATTTGRIAELAATIGRTPDLPPRRPHELGDGQLQRACLARIVRWTGLAARGS